MSESQTGERERGKLEPFHVSRKGGGSEEHQLPCISRQMMRTVLCCCLICKLILSLSVSYPPHSIAPFNYTLRYEAIYHLASSNGDVPDAI